MTMSYPDELGLLKWTALSTTSGPVFVAAMNEEVSARLGLEVATRQEHHGNQCQKRDPNAAALDRDW